MACVFTVRTHRQDVPLPARQEHVIITSRRRPRRYWTTNTHALCWALLIAVTYRTASHCYFLKALPHHYKSTMIVYKSRIAVVGAVALLVVIITDFLQCLEVVLDGAL